MEKKLKNKNELNKINKKNEGKKSDYFYNYCYCVWYLKTLLELTISDNFLI